MKYSPGTVLAGLAIIGVFMSMIATVIGCGIYLLRHTIKTYRRGLTLDTTPAAPQVHGWTITYKSGKVQKSVTIPAATEAEALLAAAKVHHIRYDKIISSVKN